MLDITKETQSLAAFRRNSGKFMKQLKQDKRPIFLTVEGEVEAVLQDAGTYQRLMDIAARADAREGIRQGMDDLARGQHRPAREALEEFRSKHGIPR